MRATQVSFEPFPVVEHGTAKASYHGRFSTYRMNHSAAGLLWLARWATAFSSSNGQPSILIATLLCGMRDLNSSGSSAVPMPADAALTADRKDGASATICIVTPCSTAELMTAS